MLNQPLLQQLDHLGLRGMSRALTQQQRTPDVLALAFEERLTFRLEQERLDRLNHRIAQRLRWAKLTQNASLEDIDLHTARGLDRLTLARLTDLQWIAQGNNVLISGPTGVGKSYLACALAQHACRNDIGVHYFRLPRLHEELVRVGVLQKKSAFFKALAKTPRLVRDDFGLTPLPDVLQRDLLEILDDRYQRQATLITSQLPIEHWHSQFSDPTLADAILDRLVHNAHLLTLKGESMQKSRRERGTIRQLPVNSTTKNSADLTGICLTTPAQERDSVQSALRWPGIRRNGGPTSPECAPQHLHLLPYPRVRVVETLVMPGLLVCVT